jgi:elongation factor Ts
MTGAGMMDCKKALSEADGDFDKAIDILRKQGQKVSAKRADRETSEGAVFVSLFNNDSEGIILGLGCETDFVAKNESFQNLGKAILAVAVANKVTDKEALLALPLQDGTVESKITELVGTIGEKISIVAYGYEQAEKLASYIHSNGKIGVLVALNKVGTADYESLGRDLGMQIAAMNPIAVDGAGVSEELKRKELEIGIERARAEGKSENILEKIAQGYVQKFLKENTLLEQPFVKDNKITIKEFLKQQGGVEVKSFIRASVGE